MGLGSAVMNGWTKDFSRLAAPRKRDVRI